MKPHIIVKLKESIRDTGIPHWSDIITDKSKASSQLYPPLDAVVSRFGIPSLVTREYKPAGVHWSAAEKESGLNRIYRIILKENTRIPPSLIKEIQLLPIVEYVRFGEIGTSDLPRPRDWHSQMAAVPGNHSREMIYLPQARAFTRGDPSITIAVLDTGISLSHPELKDALLEGYDFVDIIDGAGQFFGDYLDYDQNPNDEVGHGTHVAGIIAGKGISMPIGIVPRCKILPVRVLASMKRGDKAVGAGLKDNINVAIKWAVDQGADIINMSLGIRHTGGGLPHKEVVDYAQKKGVSIVAAAGNDGKETLYYPGALPYVIAVGAFDNNGEVAHFSTYGEQVDFVAPGTDIYSTYLDKTYAFAAGTSHAAPFVSGAAAMLKSFALKKGKRLSDKQIKYVLKHTADKTDRRFKSRKAGFGKINLIDALRLLNHKLN
jgi:subtilisin family serine protease